MNNFFRRTSLAGWLAPVGAFAITTCFMNIYVLAIFMAEDGFGPAKIFYAYCVFAKHLFGANTNHSADAAFLLTGALGFATTALALVIFAPLKNLSTLAPRTIRLLSLSGLLVSDLYLNEPNTRTALGAETALKMGMADYDNHIGPDGNDESLSLEVVGSH